MLLMIPFVAMQFTTDVAWSTLDFGVMGVLIFSFGLLAQFATQKSDYLIGKTLLVSVVILAFLLVWAELAVGIFGTPFAGS